MPHASAKAHGYEYRKILRVFLYKAVYRAQDRSLHAGRLHVVAPVQDHHRQIRAHGLLSGVHMVLKRAACENYSHLFPFADDIFFV